MIEQGLFKRHFVGRDGFIWWVGQVVSEEKWSPNIPGYRSATTEDHRGFGERYKVRIMGYHTAIKRELTDDELPWASVVYPVTAGSGSAGTWSNAALRQGNYVFGFFIDGEDAQQPVILGVIGYNQYTSITKQDNDDIAFTPFSGYTNRDTVARFSSNLNNGEAPQATQNGTNQSSSNRLIQESVIEKSDGASGEQYKNGRKRNSLLNTSTCEKVPLGAIQREIKNLIADIERIRKTASDWETKVTTKINNIESEIRKAISNASEFIAGGIKWLIEEVQKFTTNKMNNAMKDTYYLLFPNQRPKLKRAVENANDLIACLFRKIIGNLLKIVGNFLQSAIDRFINTPLCAVENFVGALIGKLAGLITSTIDAILGPVKAIVGAAFDLADGILNFITDLLSFLSCDETPSCAEIKEWSIWNGTSTTPALDLNSVINKVESVASTITEAIDPNNFDFDLNFDDVFDSLGSCNIGPIFCGPPAVEFFGGGGSGATGNAIINAVGEILGVDIITPGSGYTSAPFVSFVDSCGNGNGATGIAILDSNGGVSSVAMDNSGTGYLSSPDGSLGGDERTWATADQTTVKRSDGTYDQPYSPGQTFQVNTGDEVYFNGTTTTISELQTLTARELTRVNPRLGTEPSLNNGTYPIILEIGDVYIADGGFGYNPNDQIIISPNNGANMKPEFDSLGTLTKVNLISSGQGFTQFPEIYIESDTGFNAKIIPIFKVRKIDTEQIDVPQNQIISVVDCVGKF